LDLSSVGYFHRSSMLLHTAGVTVNALNPMAGARFSIPKSGWQCAVTGWPTVE
jgi:hypothetical protein